MKFEVQVSGPAGKMSRTVELQSQNGAWQIAVESQPVQADVLQIDAHTFSILLDGRSYTLQITGRPGGGLKLQTPLDEFTAEVSNPRAWRGRRQSAAEAEGRQQVVAPMPGKVVRLLVGAGEKVQARQGLLVVEAMKMQNEIRSPKSGCVERLLVKEGQAVNAGDVLAWVE